MKKTEYTYRFLARFVIEAVTPLAVKSGDNNMLTDSLVALDVNGLPYIPGTSIAGVIRHAIGEEKAKEFFGKHESEKADDRHGSNIIFTECRMVGKDGTVVDGMVSDVLLNDDFYSHFRKLPIRQHVRINHRGVASDSGKFDEQVVFKGTRFCFELEMLSQGKEGQGNFDSIIRILKDNALRIGSSTRRGLGEIKIYSFQTAVLNLNEKSDLEAYLNKPSSLNDVDWSQWKQEDVTTISSYKEYRRYELRLKPDDFFLFGSGMGDDDADMIPVKETCIDMEKTPPDFNTELILIPGASVKGALAHRVAFYYNQLTEQYADDKTEKELDEICGSNNLAVKELFGYEGEKKEGKTVGQKVGNVIISDVILGREGENKLLNHVAIDRFTGGTIDGALFSEKVIYDPIDEGKGDYLINVLVRHQDYSVGVITSLERALKDICCGMLPLGGGVNRGHGCFSGKLYQDGKEIYDGTK
ncbi:RAMP superfamily CRISPR-associated protein [uncultured Parabacteroides sp.]|uniref:RAMP superfamily CRISPR-associated protein n=1 Tax=uncultured Parabacteroides sp. TaxID=512312 RepID=UPI0025FDF0A3|nr:RAMP superfamily CRISPR-associated protein [uncultured Parabacteroides sp.]